MGFGMAILPASTAFFRVIELIMGMSTVSRIGFSIRIPI